jgi:glycosyltransferase involved in cell wall biosynthesis
MKPLVSVLLPAYNTEQYIGQTIESVLNQTLTDWELVVSDDASPDRTVAVIERYRDPRIRLHRQPRNLGIVANWAFVVGEGRGEFGYLLGGDDVLEPTHLERKIRLLSQHPRSLFVHGPLRLIDATGAFIALGWTGARQETSSRGGSSTPTAIPRRGRCSTSF